MGLKRAKPYFLIPKIAWTGSSLSKHLLRKFRFSRLQAFQFLKHPFRKFISAQFSKVLPLNSLSTLNPTFSYLDELSGNNRQFKLKIIQMILEDLPKDQDLYHYALSLKNYHWAADIVHRIKQRILFFQMTESLKLADKHENLLREGKATYHTEFNEIVNKILKFLENSHE